jgi:hypothetical protein
VLYGLLRFSLSHIRASMGSLCVVLVIVCSFVVVSMSRILTDRVRRVKACDKDSFVSANMPTEELDGEQQRIRAWRLEQFLSLGFPLRQAELLARREDIDWHRADNLLRAGCPHERVVDVLL